MYTRRVVEGTGIHSHLALSALDRPCVPFFPRVTFVAVPVAVGVSSELSGDAAGNTNHCLDLLNIGF